MRYKFAFLAVMLALQSCATAPPKFNATVDALTSQAIKAGKTYILLPGNQGVTWNDLEFQEYARYLMRVLAAQDFVPTKDVAHADVAIVLFYGIGDPEAHQYSYSLPVWGQTGIASSNTYGTITTYGDNASFSGTTTYTPTYGITGYAPQSGSYTTYFRYARIIAYDFSKYRATKEQVELWKTTVTSTGSSGDLRRVFPLLIAAAAPYLDTNTGQQVKVSFYETDPVVMAVEGKSIDEGNKHAKP